MICLYFHTNLRFKVETVLKYFSLIRSGLCDIPIFEVIFFLFFQILTISISFEVSTLLSKLRPCYKKVFDGDEVLAFTESQQHWEALGGKTTLIQVDSSIWHQQNFSHLKSKISYLAPLKYSIRWRWRWCPQYCRAGPS